MDVNDPTYTPIGKIEYESNLDSESDKISGPNFADFASQLKYGKSKFKDTAVDFYSPYKPYNTLVSDVPDMLSGQEAIPADAFSRYGNSKLTLSRKDTTTIFMVDSKNRDQSAFPQPTNFTLRPPRIYKNVVRIEVSQLKLLTSFYYFSATKGNTILPVREEGRESINTVNGIGLTEAVEIPDGTYVINDLLQQLQVQMNYTPLFYDFPGGINEFISRFTVNGDLSLNFNQPGDSYYDSLNNKYITNPTMTQIISYYWPSQYTGLTTYTESQVLSAYYFPVLYELVIDTTNTTVYPLLNLYLPPSLEAQLQGADIKNYIIFNTTGISDPIVAYIITENITILDIYRTQNTFRYYLVNRYQLSYNINSLFVNIFTTSLNTSLVNLINITNSKNYTIALTNAGLTATSYSNTSNAFGQATAIFNDMYNYLQTQLINSFAIGYATYSSQFFLNPQNQLYIQNGIDATNVRTSYTLDYLTSGQIPINSSAVSYSNSPGFWPNFNRSNTYGGSIQAAIINNDTKAMTPYIVATSNFLYGDRVIDTNFIIKTDTTSHIVNSLIKINPARYTIFKFKSPVRQSLQVETLPLPYYYRFSDYNKQGLYPDVVDNNGNNMPAQYFDISYAFVYNSSNSLMDSSNYNTTKLSSIYGQSYSILNTYTLNSRSNIAQFEFVAPYPSTLVKGLVAYNTALAFTSLVPPSQQSTVSTLWVNSVQSYLYHDRGAFMADLLTPGNENSNHYIASAIASNTSSDITFNFSTFAGNTYYTIFRSTDPSCPLNIPFSPSIYYPVSSFVQIKTDYINFNPLANPYNASNLTNYPFVVNYNKDFLRLPVSSNLWGIDPTNSTFAHPINVVKQPSGYDISGVSNDLTDYYTFIPGTPGFVPSLPTANNTYAIDPLSQYTFKYVSQFDPAINSYFNPGSSNLLLTTKKSEVYNFKGVSTSQINIVHWYDGYSIPLQRNDVSTYPLISQTISSSATSSISDYLEGFPTDPNGNLQFGYGINAIGFIPKGGLYSMDSFAFKSILYPIDSISTTTDDPNSIITHIGIYKGITMASATLNLSTALVVLSNAGSVVYSPLTQSNTPGFGVEYGTWYNYSLDTSFSNNTPINGYTQGSNELLNSDSMYYVVPFNSKGVSVNYTQLAGSLLPYPLSQVVSTGSTYFGQTVGFQTNYFMPSTISNPNPLYQAQAGYAYTQSQYQQSQPITTTSIGYRDNNNQFPLLVKNNDSLYGFNTTFSNSLGLINAANVGMTTHFSEYNASLYMVNSLSNMSTFSSGPLLGGPGAAYASSISTIIQSYGTTNDSIYYLVNPPSTLQNYTYTGLSSYFSTITFQPQPGTDISTTIQSYQFDLSTTSATVWLWGGGGATLSSSTSGYGGAGAYAKAQINVQMLYSNYGISTVYFVVGKGGNRDNDMTSTVPVEQRYGGGGTTLLPNGTDSANGIAIQGGGFSGIFMTSTLSSPILIVGGGGAGADQLLGGPGGFGIMPVPTKYYQFSTVVQTTPYYYVNPIKTVEDVDSNSYYDNYPVASTIDGNLASYWEPTGAYINSANFNTATTVSTYRVALAFNSNISTISRIRLYASSVTGVTVYANSNKIQMLYSNNAISYSNLFQNQMFDMSPISQLSTTSFNTSAFVVGGVISQGTSTSMLQYSVDGSNWARATSIGSGLTSSIVNSVLYASTMSSWFACGQNSKSGTPILKSLDGLTWSNASIPTPNTSSFTTMAYGGNTVVASDGKHVIYTTNGNTWLNAVATNISKIRYVNTATPAFWGMGIGVQTSVNGINWSSNTTNAFASMVYDVAFQPTTSASNGVVAQRIDPGYSYTNLAYTINGSNWLNNDGTGTSNFTAITVVYGAGRFVAGGSTTDGSSCIKYSLDGGYTWLNSSYPNTVNQTINELQYLNGQFIAVGQCPKNTGAAPSQRSILRSADGISWAPILMGGFNSDIGNNALCAGYGPISITPNVSTLYMEFQSAAQPYIYEIQALTVSSMQSQTANNALSTMIDTNLDTSYWPAESQTTATTDYSFTFRFSSMTTVNTLELYLPSSLISPTLPPAYFTGLSVQGGVYSNSAILSNDFIEQPGGQYLYTAVLPVPLTTSSLTMTINKTTTSSIQISEVKAIYDSNIGQPSMTGFCGGTSNTMKQYFISYDTYNGGGGALTNGGVGVSGGMNGGYLYGGGPGVGGNQLLASNFSSIVYGAGGGGGGFYGGAGGGSTIMGLGGAGGGGAGYYNSLITLLDYGVASPMSNSFVPGSNEQVKVAPGSGSTQQYGQGGSGTVENGMGAHGIICIDCIVLTNVDAPVETADAIYPSFIDGSKLTVFQASVPTGSNRSLNFTSYTDTIQSSPYSNYNWVWYNSYLSLTGGKLLPTMKANSAAPSFPAVEYPFLPMSLYTVLATAFSPVSSFFGGNTSVAASITYILSNSFSSFQSTFVQTLHTDPRYYQFTELYGLLDYLQNPSNLLTPHVNPYNPQVDRVFGGLPRFGYWANPFFTNASYLGYDVATSQTPTSALTAITGSSASATAMYGLVLEQSLITGVYELKDIMAYKPTTTDAVVNGSGWLVASQFTESYIVRSLSNAYIQSNVPVQPYSFGSAIQGRIPLFKYSVYTTPTTAGTVPIQLLNDFEGNSIYMYTFQESAAISTATVVSYPFTSTMVQVNQTNITARSNAVGGIIGTVVSQYDGGTSNLAVTQFGLVNTTPIVSFSVGPSNLYNAYSVDSLLDSSNVGKAVNDYNGNLYETTSAGPVVYENVGTSNIVMSNFYSSDQTTNILPYASPKAILTDYRNSIATPYYDFFMSKYTNLWHVQGASNTSTIYGARLNSKFDYPITNYFLNQIFYPTHKISLIQQGVAVNPIIDGTDLITYPSYSRTEMFFYPNYSTLVQDISGQFAQETASNFQYMDSNSGYFLDSYLNNIYLRPSPAGNNPDSYNYLAIRAYSPSETFQTLVRFSLPGRYDYGFISLLDLSNEIITVQTDPNNVNPQYATSISVFNSSFSLVKTYGSVGFPGYGGSTITTNGFGDFLKQYSSIYTTVNTSGTIINNINTSINAGLSTLITGDLKNILPSYIATRARPTDPLEFSLPFSSFVNNLNSGCASVPITTGEYGLGYNLGYSHLDTPYATTQLAGSFFRILDDYIYLRMNPEYNMNRLDISRLEDFSVTHDTRAESQLYNCKLLLNTFGTYSTTFVQNPVECNPPIGKLDKLIFTWYDSNGNQIDNSQCDWSAAIQIVERSDIATSDSTAAMAL